MKLKTADCIEAMMAKLKNDPDLAYLKENSEDCEGDYSAAFVAKNWKRGGKQHQPSQKIGGEVFPDITIREFWNEKARISCMVETINNDTEIASFEFEEQ